MKKTLVLVAAFAVLVSCGDRGKAAQEKARQDSLIAVAKADSLALVEKMSHTAQSSLDFQGIYKGVVPCADCEGIETVVTLTDSTFTRTTLYVGKKNAKVNEEKGTFSWNADGNTIVLIGVKDAANQYFVGENMLKQLDLKGKVIEGELAEKYILLK